MAQQQDAVPPEPIRRPATTAKVDEPPPRGEAWVVVRALGMVVLGIVVLGSLIG